jgi:RHH-type transcriptional regulator, proline utilization regulon repressor / proline dehydrogenase / delta 1-pyrroline-5-carboxylate dehydrogenase
MEVFLAEYGLSTDEGIALMCLAEALLRVPDAETMDALIEDKIAPSNWGKHLGRSASSLVNASTWALMLTGRVLDDSEPGIVGHLRAAVKRLGEPVIRTAVGRAMKEMGRQFVLGETIESGDGPRDRAGSEGLHLQLRHAGRGGADGGRRAALSPVLFPCDHRHRGGGPVDRHPREPRHLGQAVGAASALRGRKARRVMAELVPRVRALAGLAKGRRTSASTSMPRRPTGWPCRWR